MLASSIPSQEMPTAQCTRWEPNSESGLFKSQNKTRRFESMVISYFQRVRTQCKVKRFYTMSTQKNVNASNVDSSCGQWNNVFDVMECYYHYCPFQEARPFLTEEKFREALKRGLHELRKQYQQDRGYSFNGLYECHWWKMYKTDRTVEQHLRKSFS